MRVGGRAMSSALWLTPPHASVLNALLAQKGGAHTLSRDVRDKSDAREKGNGSRGRSPSPARVGVLPCTGV